MKKAKKKTTGRRVITLETFAGCDMLKMKPLELIDYALAVMRYLKAKPSRLRGMIHGHFVETDEKGHGLRHGLCGCAVGAMAIYDGEIIRESIRRTGNVPETQRWLESGAFGSDLMASLSRAYEGSALKRMIREAKRKRRNVDSWRVLTGQRATKEDVDAVIARLLRLRPQVVKMQRSADKSGDVFAAYDDAQGRWLRKADPEFGSPDFVPEDLRGEHEDLMEKIDYGRM